MNTARSHCFPDTVIRHVLVMLDWSVVYVLVTPSETFGKAIARLGIASEDIRSVEAENAPMHYEPDFSIASR